MAALFIKQNLRYLATIYTQDGIAKKVGHGLSHQRISGVIHGVQRLTLAQLQAIEREYGIPKGWLHEYPIKTASPS